MTRERMVQIIHEKDQCLREDETLIYVKGNVVVVRYNDGESLSEITMNLKEKIPLQDFLENVYAEE